MIPLCEPYVNVGNAKEYINDCIETNWVTAGSFIEKFEEMIANYLDVKYVVAVSSGTAALHLSLLVGGVYPNEEVIVPAISFVATANAVKYVGASPTFIDCVLGCIDLECLEDFLRHNCEKKNKMLINKETQRKVSAILPVHLFGHPVPYMPEIRNLANEFNLLLIEDAAQALGSSPIGKYGDTTCLSFNGNKIITCGGGGAVATNDERIANSIRHFATQAKIVGKGYFHSNVGYNYRLSNLQAALGCAQMEHVDSFVRKKKKIANIYLDKLPAEHINLLRAEPVVSSNYWISIATMAHTINFDLSEYLKKEGIQSSPLWIPLPSLPMYKTIDLPKVSFPYAYELYSKAIMLPSSVSLTEEDQDYICYIIDKFFRGYDA